MKLGSVDQNSVLWTRPQQKLVATATSLERSKNDYQIGLVVYSPTNSANMAKIGLVDFEITGLTGIVKIF